MKLGDYVRTLDGIMKVTECRNNRFVNEDGNVYFYNDMICNPSQKLIDLIEVGDYVNDELVQDIIKHEDEVFIKTGFEDYSEDEIKSIVTKEQFESMKYVVKED